MSKPKNHFAELMNHMAHEGRKTKFKRLTGVTGITKDSFDVELGVHCRVDASTVNSWRSKGVIPGDPKTRRAVAEFGMEQVKMPFEWLQEFVKEATPHDPESLLNKYRPATSPLIPVRPPHNLPPLHCEFIGRRAELGRILEGLNRTTFPVIAIEGFSGVGKTTLAIWAAEHCLAGPKCLATEPFMYVVWTSAGDFPNLDLSLNDVLNAIVERVGFIGYRDLPIERKQEQVYDLLQTRRVLVVVDNMETVTDSHVFEFLCRIRGLSRAFITSRKKQYRQVWEVVVEGLDESQALEKVRSEIRSKDVRDLENATDKMLQPLIQVTEGNPIAIELTLGFVKKTGTPLEEAVRILDGAVEDVEGLFPYLFERAWESSSVAARNLLLVTPLFTGDIRRAALREIVDLPKQVFNLEIKQLMDLSLLNPGKSTVSDEVRYAVRPLTKAYCGSKLKEELSLALELRKRWIMWYMEFAEKNGASWGAYDLLEEERQNLIACLDWCFDTKQWPQAIELERALTQFFKVRGHLGVRVTMGERALQAAQELGDEIAQAEIIVHTLISALEHQHEDELREKMGKKALAVFKRHKDKRGIALATYRLGTIAYSREGYAGSRALLDASLAMWKDIGDEEFIAQTLEFLGLICLEKKRFKESKKLLEEAWNYEKNQDRPHRQGRVKHNLGLIEMEWENLDEAGNLFNDALALFDKEGHVEHRAWVRYAIALVKRKKGQLDDARRYLYDAIDICRRIETWPRGVAILTELYSLEWDQDNSLAAKSVISEWANRFQRLGMLQEKLAMEKLLVEGLPKVIRRHRSHTRG